MNQAIIGLGSNIDPHKNVTKARAALAERFQILESSRFSRTKPIGYKKQPDFINGAMLIATHLDWQELRQILKEIENNLGRVRQRNSHGPRVIDLDLLVFNHQVVHQDVYERDFIRKAVTQLQPEIKDAVFKQSQ